jgi:hypothetical protein
VRYTPLFGKPVRVVTRMNPVPTSAPPATRTTPRARGRDALRTTLPPWVTARALVGIALVTAHLLLDHVDDPLARRTTGQGLLAWDGAFYADIAQHGYGALPRAALRFFPLTPLLGRGIGLAAIGPRVGVVIVANVAALLAGALLVLLVRREGLGVKVGRDAAWLLALAPASFVLVLGYAEALFLALALGTFLAIRDRRWLVAAALALVAGLDRPGAVVLAVPIAVEGLRGVDVASWRDRGARALAVLAPFAGTAGYLAWVGDRFGDAWLPYSVQTRSNLKGSFRNPIDSITDAVDGLVHGRTVGTGLHVVWMVVVAVLIVVCFRRLPSSYGWYALATVASAVTSSNLDSFERYAIAGFPVLVAAALLVERSRWDKLVIAASGVAMTGYATLAYLHRYVP